jgi:hypothetical protein
MKSYLLFLDDIRTPEQTFNYTNNDIFIKREWEIVRSYNEFIFYINNKYLNDNMFPRN